MKQKKPATERVAEKAFDSNAFQVSWQIHLRAFGPLLAPAFADNEPARVHLCNALNHIARGDAAGARKLLGKITSEAKSDADRAMLAFAYALACESQGDGSAATRRYRETVGYSRDFYLPYAKLARAAHLTADFEAAADHYREAIRALLRGEANEQTRAQIASLRVNLASALTMMHDYEAAAEALAEARADLPEQPGREATEAILAAAEGDAPRVEALIATLSRTLPPAVEETRRMTTEILAGKHPHFSPMEIDPAVLDAFWQWCAARETTFTVMLRAGKAEDVGAMLGIKLAPLSPYLLREVKVTVTPTITDAEVQGGMTVTLGDYFMVALRTLYEALIARRPAGLLPMLTFCVGH